jgi:hypothetical protein
MILNLPQQNVQDKSECQAKQERLENTDENICEVRNTICILQSQIKCNAESNEQSKFFHVALIEFHFLLPFQSVVIILGHE